MDALLPMQSASERSRHPQRPLPSGRPCTRARNRALRGLRPMTGTEHGDPVSARQRKERSQEGSEKKGRDERAHFPPGACGREVAGGPLDEETALGGPRFTDREHGVEGQEDRDLAAGIMRNYMPVPDGSVTKARTAPLAGGGLSGTVFAISRRRMGTTAATGPFCRLRSRLRRSRRFRQTDIGAGQQHGHDRMHNSRAK